jgi:ArsR family transcriptional regulator, arsenate/arsenite/antimonite-responsive transcriptional repressor
MAIKTKRVDYLNEDIELARFNKALSHPARVAILNYLNKTGKCIVSDLVRHLPIAQATVSQHIKELLDSGFLQVSHKPPKTFYSIDKANWKKAMNMTQDFLNFKFQKPAD